MRNTPAGDAARCALCRTSPGAVWFRSAFLAALVVLALDAVFGTGTGYWHTSYALFVEEPLITIGVFGALAAAF